MVSYTLLVRYRRCGIERIDHAVGPDFWTKDNLSDSFPAHGQNPQQALPNELRESTYVPERFRKQAIVPHKCLSC